MAKRTIHFALAAFLATAVAGYGVAFADDDDDDIGASLTSDDDDDDGGAGAGAGGAVDSTEKSDGGGAAASGGPYKMGISTAFPTGGDAAAANLLWGLGADVYLDIRFGLNFFTGEQYDPINDVYNDVTIFGTEIGVGYRMYKPLKGRIRPYLEPMIAINIADFSAFADTLSLGVGAMLGVDLIVIDQFTLGTGIGAQLSFADSFGAIDFHLLTNYINATFMW